MPPHRHALALRHAILLGLLEGPTELLPVSSSAHTILVPLLAGWPYDELDAGLRKSFEVSLHAGAALALAIRLRRELRALAAGLDRRSVATLALSSAPPACAGLLLAQPIERRLGGPRATAAALAVGALAMALADTRPGTRRLRDAGPDDALAIGVAQAIALFPGVSRSGAALAAARARGFQRRDAHALSWRAALPVMLGASLLSGARAARRGLPPGAATMLAAGGGGALCSTLASTRLLCRRGSDRRALLPFSLYRLALAALVARRLRGRAATPGKPLN
jgi:undecaprenyl-diphosphatase